MPCQSDLDRPLGAVFRQNAGTSEFQEALARMARDQFLQLEFAVGIEAAGRDRDFLPQEPVGADDALVIWSGKRRVEHQKMVADFIEAIGVAPRGGAEVGLPRAELIVKDAVADFLGGGDLGGVAREANFQRAYASQRSGREHMIGEALGEHGRSNGPMSVTIRQGCMHG